jgi:DNA-binding NarL/FixJ family response regulator
MVAFHPDAGSALLRGPASPSPATGASWAEPVASRPLATSSSEPAAETLPVVLTARALVMARPSLVETLRLAHYLVRVVPAWDQLLDAIEGHPVDAVLVDLDGVNRGQRGHIFDMSGHRLVSLLARLSPTHRFALMVQTALDFAEIQDLVRLGTHALIGPDLADEQLVPHIHAALRRVRPPRCQGILHGPDIAPMPATDAFAWPPGLTVPDGPPASGSAATL